MVKLFEAVDRPVSGVLDVFEREERRLTGHEVVEAREGHQVHRDLI